jgi:hypothetical protein
MQVDDTLWDIDLHRTMNYMHAIPDRTITQQCRQPQERDSLGALSLSSSYRAKEGTNGQQPRHIFSMDLTSI